MPTYIETRTRREIENYLAQKGLNYCVNRLFEMAKREEELKNELRRYKDAVNGESDPAAER